MSLSQRDRLLAYLRQSGLSTARAEANLDAFAHELAEQQREYCYYVGIPVGPLPDLIDPSMDSARPDEEPTP